MSTRDLVSKLSRSKKVTVIGCRAGFVKMVKSITLFELTSPTVLMGARSWVYSKPSSVSIKWVITYLTDGSLVLIGYWLILLRLGIKVWDVLWVSLLGVPWVLFVPMKKELKTCVPLASAGFPKHSPLDHLLGFLVLCLPVATTNKLVHDLVNGSVSTFYHVINVILSGNQGWCKP